MWIEIMLGVLIGLIWCDGILWFIIKKSIIRTKKMSYARFKQSYPFSSFYILYKELRKPCNKE